MYVEEVARALRLSLLLAQQATLAEDLETAMLSRSTIDQALGVIMGQNRTTRDEAFEILRAASQSRNVKLGMWPPSSSRASPVPRRATRRPSTGTRVTVKTGPYCLAGTRTRTALAAGDPAVAPRWLGQGWSWDR